MIGNTKPSFPDLKPLLEPSEELITRCQLWVNGLKDFNNIWGYRHREMLQVGLEVFKRENIQQACAANPTLFLTAMDKLLNAEVLLACRDHCYVKPSPPLEPVEPERILYSLFCYFHRHPIYHKLFYSSAVTQLVNAFFVAAKNQGIDFPFHGGGIVHPFTRVLLTVFVTNTHTLVDAAKRLYLPASSEGKEVKENKETTDVVLSYFAKDHPHIYFSSQYPEFLMKALMLQDNVTPLIPIAVQLLILSYLCSTDHFREYTPTPSLYALKDFSEFKVEKKIFSLDKSVYIECMQERSYHGHLIKYFNHTNVTLHIYLNKNHPLTHERYTHLTPDLRLIHARTTPFGECNVGSTIGSMTLSVEKQSYPFISIIFENSSIELALQNRQLQDLLGLQSTHVVKMLRYYQTASVFQQGCSQYVNHSMAFKKNEMTPDQFASIHREFKEFWSFHQGSPIKVDNKSKFFEKSGDENALYLAHIFERYPEMEAPESIESHLEAIRCTG